MYVRRKNTYLLINLAQEGLVISVKINNAEMLGLAIRKRRKELGYTQGFIADFTGLSVSFISDVERGKVTAEIGKIIKLVSTLGLDILIESR